MFLGPAVNLLTARSRHRRGTLNGQKFLRGGGGWGDCITARNKREEELLAATDGSRGGKAVKTAWGGGIFLAE